MTIRTKFIIIGFLALVVTVIFGGFVLYSNFSAANVEAREATAQELVIAVFERNLLLSDYLLNRSERAKDQVLAQNKEIEDILLEAFFVFDDTNSVDVLAQIQKNYDSITFELEKLLASGEMPERTGSFADAQSISRIFVKSQSTVDLASQVASRSKAQLIQLREGAVASVGVFSVGGVLFAIVAMMIMVSTTRKLTVLEKGAANIAKGKLDERVNIKSKDEVGMLARSFNAMAEKLQGSYVELEQRVADRTKDLSKNVAELEKVKAATLNILEDLQAEKKETVKFRQAVDSATDGVIMTTPDQKIIYCNAACEKLGGYTQKEVLGKDVNKLLVSGKTPKKVLAKLQQQIQSVKAFNTDDLIIQRKDGTTLQAELSIFPIKEEGTVQFFVGLLQDITKRAEVDKAKTEFISIASHQLRTPLTAIKLFVEMLSGEEVGKLNIKQREYMQDVTQSTERMVQLVNDLLNVSRLETGRLKIEPKLIQMEDFIQSIINEVDPMAKDKKCTLIFKRSKEKLPKIPVDPTLTRQVIHNLVMNAIRYSPAKQCDIMVELARKNHDYLVMVKDSGIGIPKEVQPRIFEKFFRADNAVKAEAEGSGLGMYVAKMIMEASRGKIWFESGGKEKGTTFYVTIPMKGMKKKEGEKSLA